jgi:hypothetical protein
MLHQHEKDAITRLNKDDEDPEILNLQVQHNNDLRPDINTIWKNLKIKKENRELRVVHRQ